VRNEHRLRVFENRVLRRREYSTVQYQRTGGESTVPEDWRREYSTRGLEEISSPHPTSVG